MTQATNAPAAAPASSATSATPAAKATKAIVRRPSPKLAEGEVTHLTRQPIDLARAMAQHEIYVARLRGHGLEIIWAPPADEHPDGVFVEDTLVMIGGEHAILTRPGAASRRGEVDSMETLIQSLGAPVTKISKLTEPATLDGGDVLVTKRHVLVGQTGRSNAAAVAQLERLTAGSSPRRHTIGLAVTGALHLKSAVTLLPDGSLIAVPGLVSSDELSALGYRVHAALEPSGGDVLCLGDRVILPADAPKTMEMLRQLGFSVEAIDVSELQKIEAGVTCMSVLL